MQTSLADFIRDSSAGSEADSILRTCVHCGFCTATCPTYQLFGDELDGPRGRIYLIKNLLEGGSAGARTRRHLDRCLSCRSCETTCPSGVDYHRLLDIGRNVLDARLPRPAAERARRFVVRETLARPWLFKPALALGRLAKPLLPPALAAKIPSATSAAAAAWPTPGRHRRRMLALAGCVQPTLTPQTNVAAARVLDRLGVELFEAPGAGCCGALRYHLDAQAAALADMRRLIDVWWPWVERGEVEAIVVTASGCAAHVKEYGRILADDAAYAEKAARVSALARDLSEVLIGEHEPLSALLNAAAANRSQRPDAAATAPRARVAFHSPCTLQHAQKLGGVVESLLVAAGYELFPVADSHLCCGSSGAYSLLQPAIATRLRSDKLAALNEGGPTVIATANVGCQNHLAAGTQTPVRHWIELIADRLDG
ncbi:glycolate oxidase subunit GlcF [Rhodocyclus tenuis]|uniref:Glycolate oxidase iron-sulfur subunit n=1 Tax=Rhodocyclus tenuis TaxID=1066 RepID=A0A840GHZ1_RHOTE|nr:glycolate oxidase subunit GlcF [Rhodocyclus tenuis]MBB4247799.1 glycolate oxidase iron-sulfur subunit [Rhodocyclus tenuis]